MSMYYTAVITKEGVYIPGVQFRNESPKHIWPIAASMGDLLAINLPPGSCWGGVGRTRLHTPPEIVVFRVQRSKKETVLEEMLRVPLKRKK